MSEIRIILKSGKDEAVRRFHPWVFSGAIARIEGEPQDGAIVSVYDKKGTKLGAGHFHFGSIAVRILDFGDANLDAPAFWEQRIRQASVVRAAVGLPEEATHCYRLVHGEGDGLSGLVVDVYGEVAVVQCHSIGMHLQRERIAEAIRHVLGASLKAVYDKSAESLPPKYSAGMANGYLWQQPAFSTEGWAVVEENGVRFKVDWERGQKTGFFLDQRENRALLAQFAKGKTVLNTFCYTGGFSAYALRAGALSVHSVDVSAKAMVLTEENMALNAPYGGTHESITEDAQKYLLETEQVFEVVVVDPPAFAKSLEKRHNAVQGYKRLNAAALQRVAPGGILFTFSCSQVVDRNLFYNTIVAAAIEVGRNVRVLHQMTQGPDHPVSLFHPEGSYLKGLVLFVE